MIDDFLNLDLSSTTSLLTLFNMTRCVGTSNSKLAQDIIIDFYKHMPIKWKISTHSFWEAGYEFNNLVLTLPHYNEYENNIFALPKCEALDLANDLVLAVHYDTLSTISGFVGAVDSAASMSILLFISLYISENSRETRSHNLKIIFFDGEEAFGQWSDADSLYGSKSLSKIYEKKGLIEKIELFILLDLLGSKQNKESEQLSYTIYNYFEDSSAFFGNFLSIEKNWSNYTNISLLASQTSEVNILIDDDHVPFQKLGVKCLHLIPLPFPSFWHTIYDDFNHLDINVIKHMALVLLEFTENFLKS